MTQYGREDRKTSPGGWPVWFPAVVFTPRPKPKITRISETKLVSANRMQQRVPHGTEAALTEVRFRRLHFSFIVGSYVLCTSRALVGRRGKYTEAI